jgi:hypothetical protein
MKPEGSLLCSQEPATDTILSQMNPVHRLTFCFLKIYTFILTSHLHLGPSSGLFPSDFPTEILY